ncbi:MAG: AAA family ATPase [Rikenellaceae bacterium]
MEGLLNNHIRLISATNTTYYRYLYKDIDWSNRLIGITGARGTGKTTMILQHIKSTFEDLGKALYISLDNIYFTKNSLLDFAERFNAYGGTHLFIDEVHRYPNWSIEIKNIYDSFPDMSVVFTGSSILEIYKSNADLSRRAISYRLTGLSFREYLNFEMGCDFPTYTLADILKNHFNIAAELTSKIKVMLHFENYLQSGFYPFYKENPVSYHARLQNVVNTILENDLPSVEKVEYNTIIKIKKLLVILSSLVPYVPNIQSLSTEIESNRALTIKYLGYLQRAGLIILLNSEGKGKSRMAKPDKIFLDNTNVLYALCDLNVNKGTLRETFFVNQCRAVHSVAVGKKGDFSIDNKFTFEVRGKNKSYKQIKDMEDSYIAMADIELGFGNKIPLWLFGFLY